MTRRWLTMLATATLFAVACFYLGQWQWHRHEGKAARAQRIDSHYTARPVPLSVAMPRPGVPLAQLKEWTTVTATGRYDAQHVMLVRNRPNNGIYGYDVVVPLRLANGTSLLVDRGWIPNGRTAADPSRAPATPSGQITVTGWLRLGEPSLGRRMTNGQLASINLAEASAQSGASLYGAYLIRRAEVGTPGQRIEHAQALESPDTGQGPHLAYALQWWLAAPVGLVLVFVGVRRELVEGALAPGPLPGGSPTPPQPVKVRKTRIWDEEDE
jgi:cytochrome oxidase assembly protein ShyY1